jgi:molybdopterin converting factor small subunit
MASPLARGTASDHSPRSDGVYAVQVLITVKLFAGLREQAGSGERVVDLPDGARIADVWNPLELGEQPPGLLFALNRRYAEADTALTEGDEVAVIPPVSGGAIRLSDEPIDPSAVVSEVADESAGAIATFIGTPSHAGRPCSGSSTKRTRAWPKRSWPSSLTT